MAVPKYLLGLDAGTTSMKAAVIDENVKILGISSRRYSVINPRQSWVQINSESLWNALVECISDLKYKYGIDLSCVAGISFSTLCPGLVSLGKNGEVIEDPITYADRRSTKEADFILEAVGADKLFEITANGAMAGAHSGTTMLWIKRNLPDKYKEIEYFGHLNTFFANRMTGAFAIDYSNASYTNLFETAGGKKWSDGLCDAIGIEREKLPELHESTDVVGELNNEALIGLGIPKGTPVIIGGADTPCATLAAGVARNGDVCESVGTTDVLTVCVDRPVFDRGFINRCHVVPGTWIYQGAMSFTGASNEWFLEKFHPELLNGMGHSEALEFLNCEVETIEAGCGGVVFLPYMLGERSPVWDAYARGVFFGLSLQTTRKEMYRAVLESCGYGLRQLIGLAEQTTGETIGDIVSIGGGAKSRVWTRIKADITGKTFKVLDMINMAPIGAALLAGVGAGVFKDIYDASDRVEKKVQMTFDPSDENSAVYEKRFRTYISLYPALKDVFRGNI